MKLDIAIEDALRQALRQAAQLEYVQRGRLPEPHEVVFRALQNAIEVMNKMPDIKGWAHTGYRSPWPVFMHSPIDREETYRQLMHLIEMGGASLDALNNRSVATPIEQEMMTAVFDVFRACCVGKSNVRDWRILTLAALSWTEKGMSDRQIGLRVKPIASQQTVWDRKMFQCKQIARALDHLMQAAMVGIGEEGTGRTLQALT